MFDMASVGVQGKYMVLSSDTVSPSAFYFSLHRVYFSIRNFRDALGILQHMADYKGSDDFFFLLKDTRFLIISTDLVQYCA